MNKCQIHTELAPAAIGPYSQGIELGSMVYTSGQIPVAPDGSVSDNITQQAHQALTNLKAVLEAAGSAMARGEPTSFNSLNKMYLGMVTTSVGMMKITTRSAIQSIFQGTRNLANAYPISAQATVCSTAHTMENTTLMVKLVG